MDDREDKIFEIARRNAAGDLTPTQFEWWCSQLKVTPDEIDKIYAERVVIDLNNIVKNLILFVMFAGFVIFSISILS